MTGAVGGAGGGVGIGEGGGGGTGTGITALVENCVLVEIAINKFFQILILTLLLISRVT